MFNLFTKEDLQDLEIRQELSALKIEVANAERWIERAKDTIETIQNKLMDIEDHGRNRLVN